MEQTKQLWTDERITKEAELIALTTYSDMESVEAAIKDILVEMRAHAPQPIPQEVRETLQLVLRFARRGESDEFSYINQRISVAESWLAQQPAAQ